MSQSNYLLTASEFRKLPLISKQSTEWDESKRNRDNDGKFAEKDTRNGKSPNDHIDALDVNMDKKTQFFVPKKGEKPDNIDRYERKINGRTEFFMKGQDMSMDSNDWREHLAGIETNNNGYDGNAKTKFIRKNTDREYDASDNWVIREENGLKFQWREGESASEWDYKQKELEASARITPIHMSGDRWVYEVLGAHSSGAKYFQKNFPDDRKFDETFNELIKEAKPEFKEKLIKVKKIDDAFYQYNLDKFKNATHLHRGMEMEEFNHVLATKTSKFSGTGLNHTSTSMNKSVATKYAEDVVITFEIDDIIRSKAHVVRYSSMGINPEANQERYNKLHQPSLAEDKEVRLRNKTPIKKITGLIFKDVPDNMKEKIRNKYKHVTDNITFYKLNDNYLDRWKDLI